MITVVVTFRTSADKVKQAQEWVGRIVAYLKKARSSWQVLLLNPMSGACDTEVLVIMHCPSLSDFDDAMKGRAEDPAWQALGKEGRESDWYLGYTRQFFSVIG